MSTLESSLNALMGLGGAMCAAVVDYNSGMVVGSKGKGVDMDIAGAGNTEILRAKWRTMKDLGMTGPIEDILITLESQYHILRPTQFSKDLFIYLVLDKSRANLALARRAAAECEAGLAF